VETPRVMVGMPATGWMPSVAHFAIVSVVHYDWSHHRYILGHEHSHCTVIQEARNMIARNFLKARSPQGKLASHLLFVDSDMTPPPDGLQKLVEVEGDIVCGLFTNRSFDSKNIIRPMVFRKDGKGGYASIDVPQRSFAELEAAGVVEVDACGMAWTLIRREVFEKLKEPWFNFYWDDQKKVKWGEDVVFCKAAQEAGFSIKCRLDCIVGHCGNFTYDISDAWACQEYQLQEQNA
jgi:hypothetical protein